MWVRIRVPALAHFTKKKKQMCLVFKCLYQDFAVSSLDSRMSRGISFIQPPSELFCRLCAHSRVYPYVKHIQISDSIKSSLWSDSTPDWFNRFCATPASNYHCHNQINRRLFACGHKGKWKGHWRVDERVSEFIGMGRGQRETEICRTISFTWETERTDLHSSCVYLTLLNHGFLNFRTASKLR